MYKHFLNKSVMIIFGPPLKYKCKMSKTDTYLRVACNTKNVEK